MTCKWVYIIFYLFFYSNLLVLELSSYHSKKRGKREKKKSYSHLLSGDYTSKLVSGADDLESPILLRCYWMCTWRRRDLATGPRCRCRIQNSRSRTWWNYSHNGSPASQDTIFPPCIYLAIWFQAPKYF